MSTAQEIPEQIKKIIRKDRAKIIKGFQDCNSQIESVFDLYHKHRYTEKGKPTPAVLFYLYEPITFYYGMFMPKFSEWKEVILKLDSLGIKKILGTACGKGGRESILYHISKMVLDEPFEIILTDGHLGKTKPSDETEFADGIKLLPVENLSASEAIQKYPDVDAYLGFMLPMDVHSESEQDECPGLCMAEAVYQKDKTLITIGEGVWGCTGTPRYWDYIEEYLCSIHMTDISYKNRGTSFYFDILQKLE